MPRNPADRPATEPRTEVGRRLAASARQWIALDDNDIPMPLGAASIDRDIAAVENEAARSDSQPLTAKVRQELDQIRSAGLSYDGIVADFDHAIRQERAEAAQGAVPRAEGLPSVEALALAMAACGISDGDGDPMPDVAAAILTLLGAAPRAEGPLRAALKSYDKQGITGPELADSLRDWLTEPPPHEPPHDARDCPECDYWLARAEWLREALEHVLDVWPAPSPEEFARLHRVLTGHDSCSPHNREADHE